jgi:hypothetical protein
VYPSRAIGWSGTLRAQSLVVNLRAGLLVGEVCPKPLSHTDDGIAEPMLAVA